MKHFYNSNFAMLSTWSAANALGTALGSAKKLFTLVLLGFFLLVSGEGFGATFTATSSNNVSGNWNNPATWGVAAPTGGQPLVVGVHYPGVNDDVVIANNYIVIVPSSFAAYCKTLSMRFSQGNVEPTLIIDGSLTAATLTLNASNQSVRASMNITVNGNLNVTTSATETGRLNFICGTSSNVTYGLGVNVITPRNGANNTNIAGTPQPFQNLIIDGSIGTGTTPATLSANVTVNGDLSLVYKGKLSIGSTTTAPVTPYVLTLADGARIIGENADNYITGHVKAERTIPAGESKNFGMGADITNNSSSLSAITITRATGIIPIAIGTNTSATRTYQVAGAPASGYNAGFEFPQHELNQPVANYELYSRSSTNSFAVVAGYTNTNYTFRTANVQNLLYTIAGPTIVPMPVELVSFKAQRHAQGVNLTWVTASEQDNSGFEVQVSTDSKSFEKIGFVESKVGTTSIKQNYSFLDTKAVSGTRYYRLKQIDLDGTTAYSSIQAVVLDGGSGQVAAYPNPFEDVVIVKLNGVESRKVKTILATAHGLIILQREVETSGNTITIDTSHVTAKGIYILHVMESDGTKHTIKLMKN